MPLAIQIYSGELLADIYDDWVGPERERFARLYRECLLRLSNQQEAASQFAEAVATAERHLAAEPCLETTHTRLMRLHYAAGNRARVAQHTSSWSPLCLRNWASNHGQRQRRCARVYLSLNEVVARKSYRDVKHYKRRKRWLS